MNRYISITKPLTWFMALLLTAVVTGCGGSGDGIPTTGPGSGVGPAGASPNIGTASTYGVFASADAAVTLAVGSLVKGDVGLMDGAGTCGNCTGLTVTGAIENGTLAASAAQAAFQAAYIDASTRATNACTIADGELSTAQGACAGNRTTPGPVYTPGLYRTADPIGVGATFTITLDALNNPDAVFIFQTDAAITTGTNSRVVLANGAKANNVWWIAGSAATLGVSSHFKGTVITNGAAITVLNGTSLEPTLVEGRLLSAAAVGVAEFATVTVPQ